MDPEPWLKRKTKTIYQHSFHLNMLSISWLSSSTLTVFVILKWRPLNQSRSPEAGTRTDTRRFYRILHSTKGQWNPDPDSVCGSRVLVTQRLKLKKKIQLKKLIFLCNCNCNCNFQFSYPSASIKDVQAKGEAFIPQKRISSTLKN